MLGVVNGADLLGGGSLLVTADSKKGDLSLPLSISVTSPGRQENALGDQAMVLRGIFLLIFWLKQSDPSDLRRNYIYQWKDSGCKLHWKKVAVMRRLMLFISYSESVCHMSFNSRNVGLGRIDDSLAGAVNNSVQLNSELQLEFCSLLSPSKTRLPWQLGTPAPRHEKCQHLVRKICSVAVLHDLNSKL